MRKSVLDLSLASCEFWQENEGQDNAGRLYNVHSTIAKKSIAKEHCACQFNGKQFDYTKTRLLLEVFFKMQGS